MLVLRGKRRFKKRGSVPDRRANHSAPEPEVGGAYGMGRWFMSLSYGIPGAVVGPAADFVGERHGGAPEAP